MILSKIHFCCKIWMAKNCKNHRFRTVFVAFLHYEFIMANITAVGHISNFIFCSLDMCPNSISYTKNYQNLSHGLCHPLPGFSMDSLLNINKKPNKLLVKSMTILASIISLCGVA